MRNDNRSNDQLRSIEFISSFNKNTHGSCLVTFGSTKVICNAYIENRVPRWLLGKKQGWLSAEYSMLPQATARRTDREAVRGKQSGRTQEIQRLIGRALRASIDLKQIGERTILIDCDVIEADGGTRCASINGAYVAMVEALAGIFKANSTSSPIKHIVSAVSCGIINKQPMLDLDYMEDSNAEVDMNFVMCKEGIIEIQGTAEEEIFSEDQLMHMTKLAKEGCSIIAEKQQAAIERIT